MIEHLFKEYGLRFLPVTIYGKQWLSSENQIYELKDQRSFHHPDLRELFDISSRLIHLGDMRIAHIVPTKNGNLSTKMDGLDYILLAFPNFRSNEQPNGESLALFHKRSQSILTGENSRNSLFLKWRDFWTKRIDDLSVYWNDTEKKNERNEYEEQFLRVFPYFSGRTENAIQYLTDLMIDESIYDLPVVSHHRFNENSWGERTLFVKTPEQWVIDHPSRDIAEWIRFMLNKGSRSVSRIYEFIDHYLERNKLSTAGLGLVFARVLFPLSFIENGEYAMEHPEESQRSLLKLRGLLRQINEEERFLGSFGKRYLSRLPRVDWLVQNRKTSV